MTRVDVQAFLAFQLYPHLPLHPKRSPPLSMSLSPEAIAEFQSLYSKEYGVVLTVEQAQTKARTLIELFKILRGEPPVSPAATQSDPLTATESEL